MLADELDTPTAVASDEEVAAVAVAPPLGEEFSDPLAQVATVDLPAAESSDVASSLVVNLDALEPQDREEAAEEIADLVDAGPEDVAVVPAVAANLEQAVTEAVPGLPTDEQVAAVRDDAASRGVLRAATNKTLKCKQAKSFWDANMTITFQNNCPKYKNVVWGLKIQPSLQRQIVGKVNERGMKWWLNGKKQGMNAPHKNVPKSYLFHGSFKPVKVPSTVKSSDLITFEVKCKGKILPGALTVTTTIYPRK